VQRSLLLLALLVAALPALAEQFPVIAHQVLHTNATVDNARVFVDSVLQRVYVVGGFADSLVVGTQRLRSRGQKDAFVAAYTSRLEPLWVVQFGGPGSDAATCGVLVSGSGLVVGMYCGANMANLTSYTIGDVTYSSRGEADVVVARLDADGNTAWSRNDGSENADYPINLHRFADGTLLVVGGFFRSTRIGTLVLGATDALESGYLQALDTSGNHRWVAPVLSRKSDDYVAFVRLADVTNIRPDRVDVALHFMGTTSFGFGTYQRTPENNGKQVVLRISSQGTASTPPVLPTCYTENSAWTDRPPILDVLQFTDYVFATGPDECLKTDVPRMAWQEENIPHFFYLSGIVRVRRMRTSNSWTGICGSYTDTVSLLHTGDDPGAICPNQNRDGMIIVAETYQGRGVFSLQASEDAEVLDVAVTEQGFYGVARASGVLSAFPGMPTASTTDLVVFTFASPTTSVAAEAAPPGTNMPMVEAGELLSLQDLAGREISSLTNSSSVPVSAHDVLRQALASGLSVAPGMYVLRSADRLSLCHVGAHNVAFPVSTSTPRQGP
jgi:hypothetical protein